LFASPKCLEYFHRQLSILHQATMSALNKIAANSPSRQNPSELETSIAGALYDLETNTSELKAALRPLQFVSAREVSN
jgi:hypothetical protein